MVCERLRIEELRDRIRGCFRIRKGRGSRVRTGRKQSSFQPERKYGQRSGVHVCRCAQHIAEFHDFQFILVQLDLVAS